MPAVRLSSRRRRSSLAQINPAKPGTYGVHSFSFAPNVTPTTYIESPKDEDTYEPSDAALFPPPSTSDPTPSNNTQTSRRRIPRGKRPSQGYIPRPPNAFMLFRADFVRQKHVPGSIETSHASLSKIIGNCWKSLPEKEKKVWEYQAKVAKAEHKARYPEYKFRPVHTKKKDRLAREERERKEKAEKGKKKATGGVDPEVFEAGMTSLLMDGLKGAELEAAVREMQGEMQATHSQSEESWEDANSSGYNSPYSHGLTLDIPAPIPTYQQPAFLSSDFSNPYNMMRRPSSCPPVQPYMLQNHQQPLQPFFPVGYHHMSRPASPGGMNTRLYTGLNQRRASSARLSNEHMHPWNLPPLSLSLHSQDPLTLGNGNGMVFQRSPSPLPEVDTTLFEPAYISTDFSSSAFSFASSESPVTPNPGSAGTPWGFPTVGPLDPPPQMQFQHHLSPPPQLEMLPPPLPPHQQHKQMAPRFSTIWREVNEGIPIEEDADFHSMPVFPHSQQQPSMGWGMEAIGQDAGYAVQFEDFVREQPVLTM